MPKGRKQRCWQSYRHWILSLRHGRNEHGFNTNWRLQNASGRRQRQISTWPPSSDSMGKLIKTQVRRPVFHPQKLSFLLTAVFPNISTNHCIRLRHPSPCHSLLATVSSRAPFVALFSVIHGNLLLLFTAQTSRLWTYFIKAKPKQHSLDPWCKYTTSEHWSIRGQQVWIPGNTFFCYTAKCQFLQCWGKAEHNFLEVG